MTNEILDQLDEAWAIYRDMCLVQKRKPELAQELFWQKLMAEAHSIVVETMEAVSG